MIQWYHTDTRQGVNRPGTLELTFCGLMPYLRLYQIPGTVLGDQNEKMKKTQSWVSKSSQFGKGD